MTNFYIANLALADVILAMFCIPFQVATIPSIKWILRVTRRHYQHHHPYCFQKIIWHEIANFVEFSWKFWKYLCLRVLKSELGSDCPDFGWQFIVFLCSCIFLLQFRAALVQRWDLPAFMCQFCPFAQILSVSCFFCTEHVGELLFFCTYFVGELCFFAQVLLVKCVFFSQKVNININIS